ncbi:hypothetical protein Moror_7930 [Moniliophthora roreri MCA 2997]|uniref:7alpha-cephem-methoxylase p8 chain related protein n=2 Tax=Moniliophthora roreri TaxID=221103 RepID=V2XBW5_MONRO|nr:hypothetical protein Moror_7930 [Moniliophthora roreri MCA 2997]KAI3604689.1 hypothetical protein WG66_008283 [Moniliophthora roreri]
MVAIDTTPSTVPASLFYFTPPTDGSKPRFHGFRPSDGTPVMNYELVKHTLPIENVRGKEDTFTLDNSGFQFVKHISAHKAFNDDAEIEKEYYPESVELLKKITGASKVVLFDHTLRHRREGDDGYDPKSRGPASLVHVDQTPLAAHNRVRRHLPEDEAAERLKHRFQIINLWRPISHPALDWPLAVCDYHSVNQKEDLAPVELVYPDRVGETFGVKYNPEHKWKYLRGITPEEVILIKCYDSIEDGSVAVFTPHTGFEDPSTPEGSPFRESIELRALVFYDD